ncbi:MAG TPA: hypothetical protein P5531_08775 [Bacteroidales bacterium]|nr:hypothetical protein [Bacteroidales bacterium]HSA43818.1 hypothetical protein [Bacteroidales bacterium]
METTAQNPQKSMAKPETVQKVKPARDTDTEWVCGKFTFQRCKA